MKYCTAYCIHGSKLTNPILQGSTKLSPVHHMIQYIIWCTGSFFPSNYWWHNITKVKESNMCDLCRDLWIEEGRFTTEDDLPIQTLGHIQPSKCWLIWISGEKDLRTIWTDLEDEFPEVFNLCSVQTLENSVMKQKMDRPMTEGGEERYTGGIIESPGKKSR
jgi:hypothetical protein